MFQCGRHTRNKNRPLRGSKHVFLYSLPTTPAIHQSSVDQRPLLTDCRLSMSTKGDDLGPHHHQPPSPLLLERRPEETSLEAADQVAHGPAAHSSACQDGREAAFQRVGSGNDGRVRVFCGAVSGCEKLGVGPERKGSTEWRGRLCAFFIF